MKNLNSLPTRDRLSELFEIDPNQGFFVWKVNKGGKGKKGNKAGVMMCNGYIKIGIDNKEYLVHRLIWLYVHGEFPTTNIDHIDRCRSNNAISNLRLATPKQNSENMFRKGSNKSGHCGVFHNKRLKSKPWSASLMHNRKTIHIGYFATAEEASIARKSTEDIYYTHHTS
tara:strand:- start:1125 stop:1634 length:510 start_codon:yes stop_codon:yes gene_type:complete